MVNYILTTGSDTLSGKHQFDTFEIKTGGTLYTEKGITLEITANKIIIDGEINGVGLGYDGGARAIEKKIGNDGYGPGAGGGGTTSGDNDDGGGGGGAGHGGWGGYGSHGWLGSGSTGILGEAGLPYRNPISDELTLGSGGGSGSWSLYFKNPGSFGSAGGAGGGAIKLEGKEIIISGIVDMSGGAGENLIYTNGGDGSGGGGSGGTIIIKSNTINLDGIIRANGGNGGASERYGGSGGGGAGGRIKIFFGALIINYTAEVFAGWRGPEDYNRSGTHGSPGTLEEIKGVAEITHLIEGEVILNGFPVAGARVFCFDMQYYDLFGPAITDINGHYSLGTYQSPKHVFVEYEDNEGKYRALTQPGIIPEVGGGS